MTREARANFWRSLVERQVESAQSGAAFCKAQNINPQRFYFWRRRSHSDSAGPGFIRLVPTSNTLCSGIRIILDHGVSIELDTGSNATGLFWMASLADLKS